MSKAYAFELTPSAMRDLDEIADYIAITLCAKESALKFLGDIEAAIESACEFPHAAPLVNDPLIAQRGYRKLIIQNYIVFYIPDDEQRMLHVMRVLYFSQDYFKKL